MIAATNVLREFASKSELELRPSLRYDHILSLIEAQDCPPVYAVVVSCPRVLWRLDEILDENTFRVDINALKRSISWFQGILQGLA